VAPTIATSARSDAKNGKQLWEFKTNSGVTGVPSSFRRGRRQYWPCNPAGVSTRSACRRVSTRFLGTKTDVPQVAWCGCSR